MAIIVVVSCCHLYHAVPFFLLLLTGSFAVPGLTGSPPQLPHRTLFSLALQGLVPTGLIRKCTGAGNLWTNQGAQAYQHKNTRKELHKAKLTCKAKPQPEIACKHKTNTQIFNFTPHYTNPKKIQ